jgi:hypothetical protein
MSGRVLSLPALLAAVVLAGCQADPGTPSPADRAGAAAGASSAGVGASSGEGVAAVPAGAEAQPGATTRVALAVRLSLSAVELPVGTISRSERIWSYLDEESIDLVHTGATARNGIRIGKGQAGTWGDLVRLIEQMTGRAVTASSMLSPPGRTVPVAAGSSARPQTMFVFRPDGTLHGSDFPPGDDIISIYCSLDEGDPSVVHVIGTPQVRTGKQGVRFVPSGGGVAMVGRPDYYPITDLTFSTTVPSGDFLVIAPGEWSSRQTSVGHHFLVRRRDGVEFELLLIIRVEALAAPVVSTPAAGGLFGGR